MKSLARNHTVLILIFVCIIILGIGIGVYFYRFHGMLSTDQSVFGTFGDYLNPFFTLISIVLLSYISISANYIAQAFNQVQLQPLLFLSFERSEIVDDQEDWIICNGYEAPAINILVRLTFDRTKGIYTEWVNCFSLAKENTKRLPWIRYADEIQVLWTDISGNRFFSIVYRDWVGTINNNISKEQYDMALENAKKNSNKNNNLNINDLISRDFEKCFSSGGTIKLSKKTYEQYLIEKRLLSGN
jgi:hypothetical protein